MEFPIEFLNEYSLWMNWVSTIGGVVIIVAAVLIALFHEDHNVDTNAEFAMVAGVIGVVAAILWGFFWPFILGLGAFLLFFSASRIAVDKIRDTYFYYRYER